MTAHISTEDAAACPACNGAGDDPAYAFVPWEIAPYSQTEVATVPAMGGSPGFDYLDITIRQKDGPIVARAVMWTAGEHGGWPKVDSVDVVRANAHLIAAAPELLEACKAAEVWLNPDKSQPSDMHHSGDVLDILQDAIAKATEAHS